MVDLWAPRWEGIDNHWQDAMNGLLRKRGWIVGVVDCGVLLI